MDPSIQFVSKVRGLVKSLKRHMPPTTQQERAQQERAERLIVAACARTATEFHATVIRQVGQHLLEQKQPIVDHDVEYFKSLDLTPIVERSTNQVKKELCQYFIPKMQRAIGTLQEDLREEYFELANELLVLYLELTAAGYFE